MLPKFVPEDQIDNDSALVQAMPWCLAGTKQLGFLSVRRKSVSQVLMSLIYNICLEIMLLSHPPGASELNKRLCCHW